MVIIFSLFGDVICLRYYAYWYYYYFLLHLFIWAQEETFLEVKLDIFYWKNIQVPVCLNECLAKTNLKTILKLLNVLLTHLCDSTTLCTLLCRCLPTSFLCNWIVSGKYKWWLLSQLVTFIAQWLRILTGSLGCIHYKHESFEKPTDCFCEVVGVPVKNSIEKAINSN